jgi:hypothetical protein
MNNPMRFWTLATPAFFALNLLLSAISVHGEPPAAPANVQARVSPSEVLLTWEPSAGADYYRIFRSGIDRRWVSLPQHLLVPRFRDPDYPVLPGYYQVAAYNSAGEMSSTEIRIDDVTSTVDYIGHVVRQASEDSISIRWFTIGGPADAVLELGSGTNEGFFFAVAPAYQEEHEFLVTNLLPNSTYWFRLTSTAPNRAGITYCNTLTTKTYVAPTEIPISIVPRVESSAVVNEDEILPLLLTVQNSNELPLEYAINFLAFPKGRISGTGPHFVYTPQVPSAFVNYDWLDCAFIYGDYGASVPVIVTVTSQNHAPYSRDASLILAEDSQALVTFSALDLERSPLEYILVSAPTNGTLRPKSNWELSTFIYIPNTNFHGIDHLRYAATDGMSTGNVATVRLAVTPVVDAPSVLDQSVAVWAGTSTAIPLSAVDPDGDFLAFSLIRNPLSGSVAYTSYGVMTYTSPSVSTNSTDSFTYQVTDGVFTRTGTVYIAVLPLVPPAAPSTLVASAAVSGQIDLAWTDNSWNEDSFQVERSFDENPWVIIATVGPNVGAYADTTFTKKKTYFYRVRALNSVGASPYSNTVSLKSLK